MRQVLLADADAGVPDNEAVVAAVFFRRPFLRDQIDGLPRGRVFNGVADDVDPRNSQFLRRDVPPLN